MAEQILKINHFGEARIKESQTMRQTNRLVLLAGTAAVIGAGSTALAAQEQAWTGNNADEVRAIVSEMMADAETRSSLLQSGGTAGHDGKGFFLSSGDGLFKLEVGGQIQFRYYLNFRDDGDGDNDGVGNDDFESGFQTRRTKLEFGGHVWDPNLFYRVSGAFDYDGGSFTLEDAFVGYRFDSGWSFRWGQFKLPFMREELVSSKYQLLVDRSSVNEIFNQGRSQGIELAWEGEQFRFAAAFSDGFNSANSDFASGQNINNVGYFSSGESDYAGTARGEFKFAGNWSQFKDFTSPQGSDFAGMVGLAGHFQGGNNGNFGPPGGDNYNYWSLTADVSLEGDGWNLFASFVWSDQDFTNALPDGLGGFDDLDASNYGWTVQGGIMIPETDWELFGRFAMTIPDDELFSDDTYSVVSLGTNYYLHGQAAKFTAQFDWYIDSLAANALGQPSDTGVGFLGDDDDNEIVLTLQFQLLF